jgi:hypothetical protein
MAYRFALARDADRDRIYELRHAIYATELRQHPEQPSRRLCDAIDAYNDYIAAWSGDELIGFVSVTPPPGPFAVEKYGPRSAWPFAVTDGTYETRLLAVRADHRGGNLVVALAYAAFRWAVYRGADRIITNAHARMLGFYTLAGLERTGIRARAGELELELMTATRERIEAAMQRLVPALDDVDAVWEPPLAR